MHFFQPITLRVITRHFFANFSRHTRPRLPPRAISRLDDYQLRKQGIIRCIIPADRPEVRCRGFTPRNAIEFVSINYHRLDRVRAERESKETASFPWRGADGDDANNNNNNNEQGEQEGIGGGGGGKKMGRRAVVVERSGKRLASASNE